VNFELVENPRSQVWDDMLTYGMRGNLFEYYMPIFRHRLEELDAESPLHLDACERTGACQQKKTDLMGESSAWAPSSKNPPDSVRGSSKGQRSMQTCYQ
jgi:hypothetical protein